MDEDIRKRLERDLKLAASRLRRMGALSAIEERPGPLGANSLGADEADVIQANESREIGFATRGVLVERVNRLSAALERLSRGEYGICVECGEPISRARLLALPEVQRCVRCQDGLERRGLERDDERLTLRAPLG